MYIHVLAGQSSSLRLLSLYYLDPSFLSLLQRLTFATICGLLYDTGQRLGTIVEGRGYEGTNQCLLLEASP